MSYWAFQADPSRYRLLHEAVDNDETTWSVNQYADSIHIGDTVVMWLSGTHAGAYALGEVTTEPAEMVEDEALRKYWTDSAMARKKVLRVRLRYRRRMLLHPILRTRALEDAVLSQMLIVRRPSGTNFPVTDKEFRRIERILREIPEKWSKEEELLALALYLGVKRGQVDEGAGGERLARLLGRGAGAITWRLMHFRSLDPSRKSDEPVSVSAQQRALWVEYEGREGEARKAGAAIEARLLLGGGLQSSDDGTPNEVLIPKALNGGDMSVNDGSNIYDHLRRRGLHFPTELVTTYLLSLKTKPFVILSGISGTGKTKLAQAVAEWAGTEEREVVAEEPATTQAADTWVYRVQPYNFRHRKVIVAKHYEDLFELPNEGSEAIWIRYDGATFQGTLGAVSAKGRRLYELRFGVPLSERLGKTLTAGDYVSFRVAIENDAQVVTLARVKKERRTRTETVRRHEFVSVRADWLDGKEVLGFFNVLTEEYVSRPFLNLLLRAHREREHPYFVILDEMNLARVEHYFADLLSATESRTQNGKEIRQEAVHLHDLGQCTPVEAPDDWQRPAKCSTCKATDDEVEACALHFDSVQLVPPRLRVPANVHVTGTVNVDETTHMFSPKVLDRANVIEFNRVDLAGYGADGDKSDFKVKNGRLSLGMSSVAEQADFLELPKDIRDKLVVLNDLLAQHNLHFGYRVANEIARYVKNAIENIGKKASEPALDLQILQKILPKLHGPKQKLMEPLSKLLLFTVFGEVAADIKDDEMLKIEAAAMSGAPVPVNGGKAFSARMPRSAAKLARMLRTLRMQGFVSFIE